MVMPYDIPWLNAWWAEDRGGGPRPSEGGNSLESMPNIGSAGGSWSRGNIPLWTRNVGNTGKDAVVTSSGSYYSIAAASSSERTVVVIGRAKGSDSDFFDSSPGRTLVDTSGGNFRTFVGSVISGGAEDTDLHMFTVYANNSSGSGTLSIDGGLVGSGSVSMAGGTTLFIGDSGLGAGNVNGSEVAFVGYINRALTTPEKEDLLAWYLANYGELPPFGAPVMTVAEPDLTEITVNWNPVAEAVGYRLYVDGVLDTAAGLITGASYTKTGLTQGVVYSFQVKAEKADTTQSDYSNELEERACMVVAASPSYTTSSDGNTSSAGIDTGLAVSVPAYLGYRWNQRRVGNQFYWWERETTPRDPMYCYLGPWSNGVTIEKVSGDTVRVIEWDRGAESWRQTDLVSPGDTATINFANTAMNAGSGVHEGPLNNSLIEHAVDSNGWVVRIWNWNPTPIPVDRLILTPSDGQITADWSGDYDHFEVRIDGGSWIDKGSATTHDFTGLENGTVHKVEVRYQTPIGPGPAIFAVGSPTAGFSIRSIPWDCVLWANESSLLSDVSNNNPISSRPKDSQALKLGDPGGSWAPKGSPKWLENPFGTGYPAFRLNEVGARLSRTPPTGTGSAVTVVTVGRIQTEPGDIHDSRDSVNGRVLLDTGSSKWRISTGSIPVSSASDSDTAMHLFVFRSDPAGNDSLEIDGVQVISGNAGAAAFSSGVSFGASLGANPYGATDIAFGATISRALTDTEKADLLTWFEDHYISVAEVNEGTIEATGPTPEVFATEAWYHYPKSVEGRRFLDQHGNPILIRGDSPWSAFTRMTTEEWFTWCTHRSDLGFNAAIVSLVGSEANGGPSNTGATFDGILPFIGGDVTNPNPDYWERIDLFLQIAEDQGITVFLYVIDGWTVLGSCVFDGVSTTDCQAFGTWLAERYVNYSNIVWMFGGDFSGWTTANNQMAAALTGIRSTGDVRPASCQMIYQRSWTTQYPFWVDKVDFNFVYSYPVQYDAVYAAWNDSSLPPLFMEGYYSGENDGSPSTLRRQAAWALTQGSPGHFIGTSDWGFDSGWESRLGTYGEDGVARLHNAIMEAPWWRMRPSRTLLLSGSGTPLDASAIGQDREVEFDPSNSTYATAAVSQDGSIAFVYLPTQRAITLNLEELGVDPQGTWINLTSGTETTASTLSSSITPPGAGDWLLRVNAAAIGTNYPRFIKEGVAVQTAWSVIQSGIEVPVLFTIIKDGEEVPLVFE